MHVCDRLAAHLHPPWPSASQGRTRITNYPYGCAAMILHVTRRSGFRDRAAFSQKRLREGAFRETCCALIRCSMYSLLHETGGHFHGHLQVRLTHSESNHPFCLCRNSAFYFSCGHVAVVHDEKESETEEVRDNVMGS